MKPVPPPLHFFRLRPRVAPAQRGSALLLVLAATVLLTAVLVGVIEMASFNLEENIVWAKDFEARQLAESGLALGMHPQVESTDPVLKQEVQPGGRIEVKVTSENSRLNINRLLAQNERRLLRSLFYDWGLRDTEANALIDCLEDWVDADSMKKLNGAEDKEYQGRGVLDAPKNRPFQSLDEMEQVFGMAQVIQLKPDWRESFTIFGDGKLDINHASAELIKVVGEIGLEQAERLVKRRWGPDSTPDTEDDLQYKDLEEVRRTLGLSEELFQKISGRITVTETARRIESTGLIGGHRHTIVLVLQRNANPPQYWEWREY